MASVRFWTESMSKHNLTYKDIPESIKAMEVMAWDLQYKWGRIRMYRWVNEDHATKDYITMVRPSLQCCVLPLLNALSRDEDGATYGPSRGRD